MADDEPTQYLDEQRVEPRDIARQALERARQSARERGARRTDPGSPPQGERPAQPQPRRTSRPFEQGREPQRLGSEMLAMFKREGWTETLKVSEVTARWREVVGDTIADHCEPQKFDGATGTLLLQASSTSWATQLRTMKGQLIATLNEALGEAMVREITVLGPAQRSWKKGIRSVPGRGPRDTYG